MRRKLILGACVLAVAGTTASSCESGSDLPPSASETGSGRTIINPQIDCNARPLEGIGNQIGIVVDESNTTIINPEIRECDHGILVRASDGVMPTDVRIIASADHPGYRETNFTLNRSAITWQAGNGEIGDVSAPAKQVGGEMYFENNYRSFSGTWTTTFRMHHTTSTCVRPCPTYSGADSPGAHWGLKFLADRTIGPPYEASSARFDHNFVQGFDDEGISFDPHGNEAQSRLGYDAGRVTSRSPRRNTVTLTDIASTETTTGMFVIVNDGLAQGASFKILSRRGRVFGVSDPEDVLGRLAAGDRVTVGGRYLGNVIDHNVIDTFHATAAKSGVNMGGVLFSRIVANRIYNTPTYPYPSSFHLRTDHQCVIVRSAAGPGVPSFSLFSSVVGNTCASAGDVSATVVSWGTYEVGSPTCIRRNTFVGRPLGRVWRYKAPQPPGGRKACRITMAA